MRTQKFIVKVFAVITRGLTANGRQKEKERRKKRATCVDVAHLKLDPASRQGARRPGTGRLVAGYIQKKGPQENARRGATNRLAGFNRDSSSRETD